MSNKYKQIYKESNELAEERMELATERISAIAAGAADVPAVYQDYFCKREPFY